MTPAETPAVIRLAAGALVLLYQDGAALRIERDGSVTYFAACSTIIQPGRGSDCPTFAVHGKAQ